MENEERNCIERNCNCIGNLAKRIIKLQKNNNYNYPDGGCSRPFLGPDTLEYFNTRPVSLYNCCTGEIITIEDSTIFRLESIDECCLTCRILNFDNGTYTSTNDFFTVNLDCISAIKCYGDINLAL